MEEPSGVGGVVVGGVPETLSPCAEVDLVGGRLHVLEHVLVCRGGAGEPKACLLRANNRRDERALEGQSSSQLREMLGGETGGERVSRAVRRGGRGVEEVGYHGVGN